MTTRNPVIKPRSGRPRLVVPLSQRTKHIDLKARPLPPAKDPALRLSPTAWAKLLYLRDLGETEVGGFGLAAADDLLHVDDIQLVRQVATSVSVRFDDVAVADYFDRQVDAGRKPQTCGRIWVHTHPGSSAQPSATDEETFARAFGPVNWAVMFILAHGGQAYARLEFHIGPSGAILLPVDVDYTRPFPAANPAAWQEEYLANVREELPLLFLPARSHLEPMFADADQVNGVDDERRFWDAILPEVSDGECDDSLFYRDEGGFLDGDF